MRAKALKEEEKERREFYDKQKAGMKDNRAKYREKVSLDVWHFGLILPQFSLTYFTSILTVQKLLKNCHTMFPSIVHIVFEMISYKAIEAKVLTKEIVSLSSNRNINLSSLAVQVKRVPDPVRRGGIFGGGVRQRVWTKKAKGRSG